MTYVFALLLARGIIGVNTAVAALVGLQIAMLVNNIGTQLAPTIEKVLGCVTVGRKRQQEKPMDARMAQRRATNSDKPSGLSQSHVTARSTDLESKKWVLGRLDEELKGTHF